MTGRRSYLAGLNAEEVVAQHYALTGRTICARRWRGMSGEIDLIARDESGMIFIEVKQSATHDQAIQHLLPGQMQRLCNAAAEFIGSEPLGQLTPVRFDLALVDGQGRIEILENAFTA